MYCKNCGNEIEGNSKFCGKCGEKVADSKKVQSETKHTSFRESGNSSHWLLWWNIGTDELQKQIDGYKTLGMTKSAKGQSVLFLLLSAVITFLFILSSTASTSAYLDIVLFVILVFFISHGHKWAMMGAMILWTLEKIYSVYQATTSSDTAGVTIFITILWWTVYMHAFWLAYNVEKEREKNSVAYDL